MKLYYVSSEEQSSQRVWIVEIAALPTLTFPLRTQALEWACTHAAAGWDAHGIESRVLLRHDDGNWRLEAAFERPRRPFAFARRESGKTPASST